MIQSNRELYQELDLIINALRLSGNEHDAKKIEAALSISTVPSEVLGEMRLVLENLNQVRFPEKLNIKDKILGALAYLNSILLQ